MVIPDKVDLVILPISLLDQHGSLLYNLQEQAGYLDIVLWGEKSPEGDIVLVFLVTVYLTLNTTIDIQRCH